MRTSLTLVAVVMMAGVSTAACGPESNPGSETGGTGGTTGGSGGTTAGSGTTGGTGGSGGTTGGAGGTTGGSAGSTTGGSAGKGGGAGTGGTTGGSAGAGGSSGTAGTGGEDETYGVVQYGTLFHYPSPNMMQPLTRAQFYRRAPGTNGPTCQRTQVGACSVTDCRTMTDPPEQEPPIPDPTPAPDAGLITIRTDGTFTADLTPDAEGIYASSGVMGSLLGEESVTVTAAGGEVPAFTHTMPYPLLMLLTEPAFDDVQTEYAHSRADDLVLSWDRGSAALMLQVTSQGSVATLGCTLPAEPGTGTIDSELLSLLDQGAELILLGVQTEVVSAGDYEVRVSSAGVLMTPDRSRRAKIVLQ